MPTGHWHLFQQDSLFTSVTFAELKVNVAKRRTDTKHEEKLRAGGFIYLFILAEPKGEARR